MHSTPTVKPSSSYLRPPSLTPPPVSLDPQCDVPPFPLKSTFSILQCLCTLASMPDRKNIFKKLYYDTLQIQKVKFLPTCFDGDLMFVLPQLMSFLIIRKPNSWMAWTNAMTAMFGPNPDHQYHQWHGPFYLLLRVRHLLCQNPQCDYLHRAHRTSPVNDTDLDGFTKESFPIDGPLPLHSTLMCMGADGR